MTDPLVGWLFYSDPLTRATYDDPVPPDRLKQYAHLLKSLPPAIDLSKAGNPALPAYLRMVRNFVVYQTPAELQVWRDHDIDFPDCHTV